MDSDQLLTKNLGQEFKCFGEWWIPTAPNPLEPKAKQGGTLTFSRGKGIKLDVMGRLEQGELPQILAGHPVEMIWGISSEGELITLIDCHMSSTTMGAVSTQSYAIEHVYVSKGAWFTPGEDIEFKSLNVEYTHLAEWVDISGFQVPSFERLNKLVKANKAEITYKRPEQTQPINVKDYAISISFGYRWPGLGKATRKATIEQRTSIFIEPRSVENIPEDNALVLVRSIQHFLNLVMYNDPVYPLVIEGQVRITGKEAKEEQNATVRLLYEPLNAKEASEKIKLPDILLRYKDVAYVWERALNKLVLVEGGKLKLAFAEFFAEYFNPATYSEDRFVATIRAIEVFHRRTTEKNNYVLKKDYHKTLLKNFNRQIDEARHQGDIDQEFQESLKKYIACGYQYTLSTRLNDLFELYGWEPFAPFARKEKNQFIDEVVATRNWLTYLDEERGSNAVKGGVKLAYLNLKLQLLMIVFLLHYIGVPREKVEGVLKNYKFDYLRHSATNDD